MKKSLFIFSLFTLFATLATAELKVGEAAPQFTLKDTNGVSHSLSDFKGKTVVLEWTNHECPFVVKHYANGDMQKLQEKWTGKDVVWLAINSTNPDHQDYKTPEQANALVKEHKIKATATLMDANGIVGKLYAAKTTPHMYVIDAEGILVYQGAIDSIRSTKPEDVAKAENYVAAALKAHSKGEPIENASTRPYGCSVKYK